MNKYHFARSTENKIRLAGQILAVEAVAITQPMDQAADRHFRLHVLGTDAGHVDATLCGCQLINHDGMDQKEPAAP